MVFSSSKALKMFSIKELSIPINQSTTLAGEYDIITHFDIHKPSKWVHEDISLVQNKVSTWHCNWSIQPFHLASLIAYAEALPWRVLALLLKHKGCFTKHLFSPFSDGTEPSNFTHLLRNGQRVITNDVCLSWFYHSLTVLFGRWTSKRSAHCTAENLGGKKEGKKWYSVSFIMNKEACTGRK